MSQLEVPDSPPVVFTSKSQRPPPVGAVQKPLSSTAGKQVQHQPPPQVVEVPAGSESSATSVAVALTMVIPGPMRKVWKTTSERLTFPITITVGHGDAADAAQLSGTATFYGKSSLKVRYTKRRSLHIQLNQPLQLTADSPGISNFVLLSLWEDKFRLAYRSSAIVLQQLGLFFAYSRLVEIRCAEDGAGICRGGTLGAYMLIEYPSDAITRHVLAAVDGARNGRLSQAVCETDAAFAARKAALVDAASSSSAHSVAIGTRNWFYFTKPAVYDILHVPSYKRNSTISPLYRQVEAQPERFVGGGGGAAFFDLAAYMTWIAANTVLQNGDYDDEVFFYQVGDTLGIMAWDYDNVLSACHRNGKNAIRTELMFCAETPLEKRILKESALREQYIATLACVNEHVSRHWSFAVDEALSELAPIIGRGPTQSSALKATFDDSPTCCPDAFTGAEELKRAVATRIKTVDSSLPTRARRAGGHVADPAGDDAAVPHEEVQHQQQAQDVREGASACKPAAESDLRALVNNELNVILELEYKVSAAPRLKKLEKAPFTPAKFALVTPWGKQYKDFTALDGKTFSAPGLYCVSLTAIQLQKDGSDCRAVIERPFVIRSQERGKAEFAVPHFKKPAVHDFFAIDAPVDVTSMTATVIVPHRWPKTLVFFRVFPAVVRITDANGRWVRKNFAPTPKTGSDGAYVVRGFSAIWISHKMPLGSESDRGEPFESKSAADEAGPYVIRHIPAEDHKAFSLHLHAGGASTAATAAASVEAAVKLPKILDETVQPDVAIPHRVAENFELKPHDATDAEGNADVHECVVRISGMVSVLQGATLTITPGCTLLMEPNSGFLVSGAMVLAGTQLAPISIIPAGDDTFSESKPGFIDPARRWQTIFLKGAAASLTMKYTFVLGSGTKTVEKETGHHHKRSAAVTVVYNAQADISDSFFLDLAGPAVAAGTQGTVRITDSLVQWAEMGAECVSCTFTSQGTVWTHFPSWSAPYTDDDNDGLYLSGGRHRVINSVIAHTKDDGIDSGTPENSVGDGGSLHVDRTIIEMVAHEGVALSSSPKGTRHVMVANSVIRFAQQGIESGYAGIGHVGKVEHVSVSHSQVGLRFGDNYRKDQNGKLEVTQATLFANDVHALNYVRNKHGPQRPDHFVIASSMFAPIETPHEDSLHPAAACRSLVPEGSNMEVPRVVSPSDAAALEEKLLTDYKFASL